MIENIILAVVSLGVLGLVFGAILGYAGKIFAVKRDERIDAIEAVLPGANCGGCGYTGCSALAAAIVNDGAAPNSCPVGGDKTALEIAKIMGIKAEKAVRYRAIVRCSGTKDAVKFKYNYQGELDCAAAMQLGGGSKQCSYGCLGYGNCVKACKFGAIKINEGGIAEVNPDLCVACGMCQKACPKNIIDLVPYDEIFWVLCASHDKALITRNNCEKGCIGCKICEKNCPVGAITVTNCVATIDYEKCINCGTCNEKCPRKVIIRYREDTQEVKKQKEKVANKIYDQD